MADDGELEDWETEWEDSLAQLKISNPPKSEAEVPPQPKRETEERQTASKKPAATTSSGPAVQQFITQDRIYEHVVELYDFPQTTTLSDLEAFVETFQVPGSAGIQ
mmetsp:Transcript_2118/g.6289  ORF Transcript_2118/g.6289 Transcript_2118/m.6289 type:complete len:106 (-) Transcript_2118:1243-1560(-)